MNQPLSIRLDPKLDARLERLAKKTGRTKSYYVKQAIEEQLEDLEDIYLAERISARIDAGREKVLSLDEVERSLERRKPRAGR